MQGATGCGGGGTCADRAPSEVDASRPSAPPDVRLAPGRTAADTGGGLLERVRELEQLDRLVARAHDGDPALAMIEGPAGIGKTRLLDATVEKAAAAGFRILQARASDLEREFAFGVVRQLFGPALADARVRERWLTGAAASAERALAPPAADDPANDASFAVLYGLFWMTANIAADAPLLLAIDDLHWCDGASLRFIAYLARRLSGLGVLLATTSRTAEPSADARLIAEIAGDQATVAIAPGLLSEAGATELIRARLSDGGDVDAGFCAACREATGGNPLLLTELLKTLWEEGVRPEAQQASVIRDLGPRAVSRGVLLRLARLPAGAIPVARAIAVLGDGAGLPATARLAQLSEARAADASRELAGAGILRSGEPRGFVHPLVRDAVYHELAPVERELAHERATEILSGLNAAPEQVAAHVLVSPRRGDARVVAFLQDVARAARRRGLADGAVAYLIRALEEPVPAEQRPRLLAELGGTEALLNLPAAVEHLQEAYDGLEDPMQRVRAAWALARMLIFTAPPHESVAVARRAIDELPGGFADERRALEAFVLYAGAFGAEVPDVATRLSEVRAAAPDEGVGATMLRAVAAWDWALGSGSAQECAALALEALADGTLVAADPGFMAIIATSVLVLADRDEALAAWDAAMREARRRGSVFAVCGVHLWQGWTWLQRGELAEAEDSLRQAIDESVLASERDGAGLAYACAFLARVLVERGDLAGAAAALQRSSRTSPYSDGDALLRRSRIELLLANGEWAAALRETEVYRERAQAIDNPAWAPWRSLQAVAHDRLGDHEAARALLEQELEAARRWGAPGALCATLRLLGESRGGEAGLELLREAVLVAEGSPTTLEHAKALAALGSMMRRLRQRAAAREPLLRAFELAGRCGAQALAEHARAELRATGARPRRDAISGPDSLTPSERRVAELAAAGESNRGIAQQLYVTTKTVEVHLSATYRKLGIGRRSALPGALR